MDEAVEEARRVVARALGDAPGARRFRLEAEAVWRRWDQRRGCPVTEVRFQVWEAAGWARLEERGLPTRCDPDLIPAAATALAAGDEPPEQVTRALAPEHPGARWRVAEGRALAGVRWLRLERRAPDGWALAWLAPGDGALLGWEAGPARRGSLRCAALGRASALARCRAALPQLAGARLASARLLRTPRLRVWRLTWLVCDPHWPRLRVTLHARSGRPCGWARLPAPPPRSAAADPELEGRLRRAVALRLGEGARISPLTRGLQAGETVWLATVVSEGGRVYRASCRRTEVRLQPVGARP